jgi:hypothetical protein
MLGKLLDSVVGNGLNAIGINKKENRNKFTAGSPSVVNAVPVVYGRPGWVVASSFIVGHKVENWQQVNESVDYNRVSVYHVCSEGLTRTPEAIKIEGHLASYSHKYSLEQATLIGGEPSGAYLNGTSGYYFNGWPTGGMVSERLDTTRAQYGDADWPYSFKSLSVYVSNHNTENTADRYINAIPQAEFLPNGIALHDPRIAFNTTDSFVYSVPGDGVSYNDAEIRALLPKSEIGGVARGWYSANVQDSMWRGSSVYNHSVLYNDRNQLGDSPDNNNALVVLDYLVSDIYGAGIPIADNSLAHISLAADYCDALAPTYSGGPTQAQMACNLVINTEDKLRDNLEKILKTCRGLLGWVDGQYQLHIPRAGIAVAGELKNNILKRRSLSLGDKSKRLNRIVATYIEPNKGYKENQLVYPPVGSAEDTQWRIVEDGEALNEIELNLEGCTNAYQAADLCAVMIRESRASITAEYELDLSGLKYTLGDVVRITDPDGAFTDKLFFIRKWEYDHTSRKVFIGVSEYADSIYDVLAHPVLERPIGDVIALDPLIIPAVTGLSFAASTYNKQVIGRLSWATVNHGLVVGYEVRAIGPTGAIAWSIVTNGLTEVDVPYLPVGEYSLEVRARSMSAYGDFTALLILHNTPSPSMVTGLQLAGGEWLGRDAQVEWIGNNSAAFKRYKIEVRNGAADVLYSEYSTIPQFDFSFDKNAMAGLGRSHIIAVAVQFDDDSLSEFSEFTINNPMPVPPTAIATTVHPNDLELGFDVLNPEPDFVGVAVEFHKVGEAWQRFELEINAQGYAFDQLDSSSNYELRLVSRDAFGDGVYSSIIAINTAAPILPASFHVEPGVNLVSLAITGQAGYVGCDVWIRNRDSAPGAASPSWSGGDSSVTISGLVGGTDYSAYYAPIDKKGVRGAIVHIPFTSTLLEEVDLSGLSDWALKTDPIDAAWIEGRLSGPVIASEHIVDLNVAKLTAGIINATIGIASGGSIESSNAGYKAGIGVYDDGLGTIYTLMTANGAGDIKGGFTADGKMISKDADITGVVTITGGSGYANISDKPTSLAGVNASEGSKLSGIDAGADVTKAVIESSVELSSGGLIMTGDNVAIKASKASFLDSAPGVWVGKYGGLAGINVGHSDSHFKFDGINDIDFKGKVSVTSGSTGFNQFTDKPDDADLLNYSTDGSLLRIARPVGASLSINSSNQTGAIKVALPQGRTNTMLKFTVDVFNYLTGKTISIEISGYNYSYWASTSAVTGGGYSLPVRFGFDGAKCCVWIGETNSIWQYPKISVRDFSAGFSNFAKSQWDSGWSISLVTAFQTVDKIWTDTHSDVTKTIIDGGLITTGAINLVNDVSAGHYGKVHSGKNSVIDTAAGFWLASTANGGEFNLGNDLEYLAFTDRLAVSSPEFSLIDGQASFSGSIAAADNRFNVSRTAWSPTYMPNGTDKAVCAIKTVDVGVAGLASYSYDQYGVYGESENGDGVRGISQTNDGGKFSSDTGAAGRFENESGISGVPTVIINSKDKAAHLQLMTRLTQFPYAPNGSICFGGPSDATARFFMRVKGKWGAMPWAGHVTDGNNIPS